MSKPTPALELASGTRMPILGLGTWETAGDTTYRTVRLALDLGYRHIDTATFYGNEAQVGRAIRDSGIDRTEIFVTTKMPSANAGLEDQTLTQSLRVSGLDYVDLWLVHWPPGGRARAETWARFICARESGRTRAIGVSNYSLAQIDELIAITEVTPEVNQIRFGPALFDEALLRAHRQRGTTVTGWAPLRSTDLTAAVLTDIGDRHGVSAAQVVLRWHLQHDVAVIPKSTSPQRLAHNIDVFDFQISPSEMTAIDTIALVSEPMPSMW